jgi:phosphopantothenoylcysteine decarboxylase/phosphopantothenate--cysteine ligase
MSVLKGKHILLGITGSIAAYKSASLIRLLIKQGAEVKVIMTQAATNFISPLTISTLSKEPVFTDFMESDEWSNHVELGLWADVFLIAPCTATTLSKLADGLADNMLIASYLSAKCPVMLAPAMDLDMWKHGSTKDNLKKVESFGNVIIPVGHGELASGLVGDGRMAEPEDIVYFLNDHFQRTQDLAGKRVLITAGPTYERIDPVRFIGNHSSGKMGIALAEECLRRGAKVTLVLGPSKLEAKKACSRLINVTTAKEMYEASSKAYPKKDIAIFAAAVADYTPVKTAKQKIKKKEGNLQIELKRTHDIAGLLGKKKSKKQLNIGFALETEKGETNAQSKLKRKNFDMIVLNSLKDKGAGFKGDTNKVTIFTKDGNSKKYPLKSKKKVAEDIVNHIVAMLP